MTIANLIVRMDADIRAYEAAMVSAYAVTDKMVTNVGRGLERLGKAFLIGVVLPLTALGVASSKAAIEFESSMAAVYKAVDATDDQIQKLSRELIQLSRVTPLAAKELAYLGRDAGQLGIKVENILGFVDVVAGLKFATNLGEDAASSLARIANIMGSSQNDFDRIGSVIVDLGNNLATTEAEIVELGLRIAGTARQVGLSEGEMLGFAGAISSLGIKAEAGGSSLDKAFIAMANAVDKGGEELRDFARITNMSVEGIAKLTKEDPAKAMIAFAQGLARINDEGGSTFIALEKVHLQDLRVRRAMLTMASASQLVTESVNRGNRAWNENVAQMRETQRFYNTTEGKLLILRNRVVELGIAIGGELTPAIQVIAIQVIAPLLTMLIELVRIFGKLPDSMKYFVIILPTITTAIIALTTVLGPLILLFKSIAPVIAGGLALIGGPATLSGIAAVVITLSAIGAALIAIGKRHQERIDELKLMQAEYKEIDRAAGRIEPIELIEQRQYSMLVSASAVVTGIVTIASSFAATAAATATGTGIFAGIAAAGLLLLPLLPKIFQMRKELRAIKRENEDFTTSLRESGRAVTPVIYEMVDAFGSARSTVGKTPLVTPGLLGATAIKSLTKNLKEYQANLPMSESEIDRLERIDKVYADWSESVINITGAHELLGDAIRPLDEQLSVTEKAIRDLIELDEDITGEEFQQLIVRFKRLEDQLRQSEISEISTVLADDLSRLNAQIGLFGASPEVAAQKVDLMRRAISDLLEKGVSPADAGITELVESIRRLEVAMSEIPVKDITDEWDRLNSIELPTMTYDVKLLDRGGVRREFIRIYRELSSGKLPIPPIPLEVKPITPAGQGLSAEDIFGKRDYIREALTGTLGALKSSVGQLGGEFKRLLKALNPFSIIITALDEAFRELAPSIAAIVTPIVTALMPVIKALFPIIKALAIAFTYVAQAAFAVASGLAKAVGYVIIGIGKAIDALPFVSGKSIINFGRNLKSLGDGMWETSKAMATARAEIRTAEWVDAIDKTTDAMTRLTSSLQNAPSGFTVEYLTYKAARAILRGLVTDDSFTSTFPGGRGRNDRGDEERGGTTVSANASVTIPVTINTSGGGAETYRNFYNEMGRRARASGSIEAIRVFQALPEPV